MAPQIRLCGTWGKAIRPKEVAMHGTCMEHGGNLRESRSQTPEVVGVTGYGVRRKKRSDIGYVVIVTRQGILTG